MTGIVGNKNRRYLLIKVDKGKLMPNGIPLLKSRKRMRRNLVIVLWKDLLASRWKPFNA